MRTHPGSDLQDQTENQITTPQQAETSQGKSCREDPRSARQVLRQRRTGGRRVAGRARHARARNEQRSYSHASFMDEHNVPYHKNDVFKKAGVTRTTGWSILKNKYVRRLHNDPNRVETRGRKPKNPDAALSGSNVSAKSKAKTKGSKVKKSTTPARPARVNSTCQPDYLTRRIHRRTRAREAWDHNRSCCPG